MQVFQQDRSGEADLTMGFCRTGRVTHRTEFRQSLLNRIISNPCVSSFSLVASIIQLTSAKPRMTPACNWTVKGEVTQGRGHLSALTSYQHACQYMNFLAPCAADASSNTPALLYRGLQETDARSNSAT